MIRVGIYLLSLTAASVLTDKLENNRFPETTEGLSSDQLKPKSSTSTERISKNDGWAIQQELKKEFNFGLKTLLQEVNSCRGNYPNLTNQMFNLRMYGFLLHKLAGGSNQTTRFQCNINTELVDTLRKQLRQLENFQKSFATNPTNNSTRSPERQTNPPEEVEANFIGRGGEGDRNDLTQNLEDELKTNHPHVSHIYLGQSVYPIITEESKYSTPRITRKRKIEPHTIAKVYELLTPYRWSKNVKTQVIKTRLKRTITTAEDYLSFESTDDRSITKKFKSFHSSVRVQVKSVLDNFRKKLQRKKDQ